ncbi:transposase [bacterium (Candidatus Blackallbacteria) CG17_big_fil_post_rev_8_21_14_2_50_48_46]|uniref:Transposase n=1 Tax=bacterium (Candidatus Blackallbacteria) CG17_big_fil_post_rev_8_21_14_2_50_48_46 TaxID=2014261 RepID=A0A2M7FZJ4_9BACT|nr:MAG: transposase [bacterium (Candidatus Blackallbacteria) CG18_big_fil_WC_8_21_14_2_50_49_26]PIW14810.1 MAG: transposase [bacterium (Candidatus Blackallbacteria) CG17_big_fil_post_rev_8_21_14_2_50_48_46]PIW50912.1 MAG: transposase [bacterium (Candidatus Blackallbacteria) CG13_big_fil_rev_8_21_14_2_50_49_14]
MRRVLLFASLLVLSSCYSVPTGYVGVKVNLYGDTKGGIEVISPGRYLQTPNVDYHVFPTFIQNVTWTKNPSEGSPNDDSITFQTSEGLSVNADIGLSYSINEHKVSDIFRQHRKGIEEITATYLRNIVRDSFNMVASTMDVEAIYGPRKSDFLNKVNKQVKDKVGPEGFDLKQISIIGTMRLPDAVVNALNAKIAATQRAQQRENELREAEAQAKRRLIEVKAESEANRLKAAQLSPALLDYERLQVQRTAIEKWNGQLPVVQGPGSTSVLDLGALMNNRKQN